MSHWFSKPFWQGAERGRGARSHAAPDPRPCFDESFREARVCLIGTTLLVDHGDGMAMRLNMSLCDQLSLGRPPGRAAQLTLRFRPGGGGAGKGMFLLRLGLHDGDDLAAAEELHRLLKGLVPLAVHPPWHSGFPGAPADPEEEDRYPRGRASGPLGSGSGGPVPGTGHGAPDGPPDREPYGGDPGPLTERRPREAAELPLGPAAAERAEEPEWVGFLPNPRTRELYEDLRLRRGEAGRR
ncbi:MULTISPECIES: hypothetical protein [unclassified Nocardiopsis]|uniref:hypothetical protein n=1 Tax=unclassified Nocardiopsis TaxID=2649073 RepID=UPI001357918D|nr:MULTISPECIES: hypothetical protein [unclassified Nocardiopsis]